MAQPTGVYVTYSAAGLREDLENVIYDISPTDTPFMSMGGRSDAVAVNHEWQTDSLAAASGTNYNEEGSTLAATEPAATTRLGNICQISLKTTLVSGTLDAVSKAGRKEELAYQMTKRASELKRDMETSLVGVNQSKTAMAADTTVRKLGSLSSWVTTNASVGSGGTAAGSGGNGTARTDGTQRTFTEALLKASILLAYDNGANTKYLMMAPSQKADLLQLCWCRRCFLACPTSTMFLTSASLAAWTSMSVTSVRWRLFRTASSVAVTFGCLIPNIMGFRICVRSRSVKSLPRRTANSVRSLLSTLLLLTTRRLLVRSTI